MARHLAAALTAVAAGSCGGQTTSGQDAPSGGAGSGASAAPVGGRGGASGSRSSGGTSGSSAPTGGTSSAAGGISGSPGDSGAGAYCSLDYSDNRTPCLDCIRNECCPEFDACVGPCRQEYACTMVCMSALMEAHDVVPMAESDACVGGCAADGVLITEEFNELMYCINVDPVCSEACTGVVLDE